MNSYVFVAGILSILLGLVHSVLGEYLIFKNKRKTGSFVPSKGSKELKERHLRILWASWHLASIFGWSIGAILIKISSEEYSIGHDFIFQTITWAMLLAAMLVLIGTKGKHPGWLVLLCIGVLLLIGS